MDLFNPLRPGSVTTDDLADGAVTYVKTDFSTTPLPVAGGGTGSNSPALVGGVAVSISGAWPSQTINNTSSYATLPDPLPIGHGGTGTVNPALTAGEGIAVSGSWPGNTITNSSNYAALADPLPVAHGGTGTATPALVAGTGISLSGSFPAQTVTNSSNYAALADPLPIAHGGTGTAVPAMAFGSTIDFNGIATITSAPPTQSENTGWKFTLWGASQAVGVCSYTIAWLVDNWLSVFGSGSLPANDASATTPDSHAVVSLGNDGSIHAATATLTGKLTAGAISGTSMDSSGALTVSGASDLTAPVSIGGVDVAIPITSDNRAGQGIGQVTDTITVDSGLHLYRLSAAIYVTAGSSSYNVSCYAKPSVGVDNFIMYAINQGTTSGSAAMTDGAAYFVTSGQTSLVIVFGVSSGPTGGAWTGGYQLERLF